MCFLLCWRNRQWRYTWKWFTDIGEILEWGISGPTRTIRPKWGLAPKSLAPPWHSFGLMVMMTLRWLVVCAWTWIRLVSWQIEPWTTAKVMAKMIITSLFFKISFTVCKQLTVEQQKMFSTNKGSDKTLQVPPSSLATFFFVRTVYCPARLSQSCIGAVSAGPCTKASWTYSGWVFCIPSLYQWNYKG